MATDSNIALTAGSGTLVDTRLLGAGDHQQVIREARSTAIGTLNVWTISLTGTTAQVAADPGRTMVLIVVSPTATGRVYIRFDTTAPTATVFHWYMDPGERWEVPLILTELPINFLGTTAVGFVNTTLATTA